ncbi:THO complex subunit 6 -like protein [Trichinella sp. T9]|nr:THO complex subunit 6 -like protein [Trichinella sp. T9]
MIDNKSFESWYAVLYSICYSPDGKLLAVADRSGYVRIFDLAKTMDSETYDTCLSVDFKVTVGFVYALASKDNLLACGSSDGTVQLYKWDDLNNGIINEIRLKKSSNSMNNAEQANCLYAAGSDGFVYCYDIETKDIVHQYKEHSEDVYCLLQMNSNVIVSGGEDGNVNFYDIRTKGLNKTLQPYKSPACNRSFGKWIGCLAVDNDALLCGGGVHLGIWYVGSCDLLKAMPMNDVTWYCALMDNDAIITGGSHGHLSRWNHCGDHVSDLATTSHSVFACCGSSSAVDIFQDLGYRSFSLDVLDFGNMEIC